MKMPRVKHVALIFTALLMIAMTSPRTGRAASSSVQAAVGGSGPAQIGAAPLILTVQTPTGGMSRLTYAERDGWRLEEHAEPMEQEEARITPASVERQQKESSSERPMTVFIDGPTGFTYAWVANHGWKFIGRLSNRN